MRDCAQRGTRGTRLGLRPLPEVPTGRAGPSKSPICPVTPRSRDRQHLHWITVDILCGGHVGDASVGAQLLP